MAEQLPEELQGLLRRMIERRKLTMVHWVRDERGRIAERMAAKGTSSSGAFVTTVAKAFGDAFHDYVKGATEDGLTVLRRSAAGVTPALAAALKQQLETYFEQSVTSLTGEVGNEENDLPLTVRAVLERSLHEAERDLAIELDLATLTGPEAQVVDEALMDPLVGLQNRRGFEAQFAARTKDPSERLCLVLFDIDRFKDVNDKHGGHAVGDEALKGIAQVASRCVKGKGTAFRWGGDEFVLLLPNHSLEEALAVAERFRREVNASPLTSRELKLSVSVGVSERPTHGSDLNALHKAADGALYDAKQRGRNVVRYSGEPEPSSPTTEREPTRKAPEAGGLTPDEQQIIRAEYFRTRMAKCPRDQAILEVTDITGFGQTTRSLLVICPMCGLSAELV